MIKKLFGLNKINKYVIHYAIGATISGIALGLAINYYFNVNIFIASVILIIGVALAQYSYNKILNK